MEENAYSSVAKTSKKRGDAEMGLRGC